MGVCNGSTTQGVQDILKNIYIYICDVLTPTRLTRGMGHMGGWEQGH